MLGTFLVTLDFTGDGLYETLVGPALFSDSIVEGRGREILSSKLQIISSSANKLNSLFIHNYESYTFINS